MKRCLLAVLALSAVLLPSGVPIVSAATPTPAPTMQIGSTFPGAVDDGLCDPTPTAATNNPSCPASQLQADQNDAIQAVERKVGTGASTPSAGTYLGGTGDGTSAYEAFPAAPTPAPTETPAPTATPIPPVATVTPRATATPQPAPTLFPTVAAGVVLGGTGAQGVQAISNIPGTLTTAAQPNITSVGTLSSLATGGNVGIGAAPISFVGVLHQQAVAAGSGLGLAFATGSGTTLTAGANNDILASFYANPTYAPNGKTGVTASDFYAKAVTGANAKNLGMYIEQPSGGTTNVSLGLGTTIGNGTPAISATAPNGSDILALVRATDSAPSGNFLAAYNAALSATVFAAGIDGGVTVGANPTGGDLGTGWINVASGIKLNNTAYINPDYVLERWATGRIVRYADRPGASTYQPLTLPQMEAYARDHWALPGFGQAADNDLFSGSDQLLARVEDGYRYLFDHEARLRALTAGEVGLGLLSMLLAGAFLVERRTLLRRIEALEAKQ